MDTRPVTSPTTGSSHSESDVQNSSGNNPRVSFYQLTIKDSGENHGLHFASFASQLGLRAGRPFLDLDFTSVNLGGSTMRRLTSGTFFTTRKTQAHQLLNFAVTMLQHTLKDGAGRFSVAIDLTWLIVLVPTDLLDLALVDPLTSLVTDVSRHDSQLTIDPLFRHRNVVKDGEIAGRLQFNPHHDTRFLLLYAVKEHPLVVSRHLLQTIYVYIEDTSQGALTKKLTFENSLHVPLGSVDTMSDQGHLERIGDKYQ
ncbi:hypothetical protein K443DRAFT_123930 [Laccaria amethystina LaAM-08-1]|uniref:Uncharacterized protein n=1 Tax=Laccaria amethystina LaAM-08-1 TaxID=1095629 RepID=A0A0C9WM69_9AGAR|nr:hypothetical protein K443DRAFT_123930 [Laccaria amethystina LaAM-08-1]